MAWRIFFLEGNNLIWNNNAKIVPTCMLLQLSMKSCGLKAEIPYWISMHKTLKFLDLSENQLEGMFPQWLADMEVGVLILSDNSLMGSLPSSLFNSQNLAYLSLARNNFSRELPDNIGNAIGLEILMLGRNKFSGKVPESISKIVFLRLLDLSSNKFYGNTLPYFRSLVLNIIDFSSNEFSSELPSIFPPSAKFLALDENKFSSNLPRNLINMCNLIHLDMYDNKIISELPEFICQIFNLQVLILRNNSYKVQSPTVFPILVDSKFLISQATTLLMKSLQHLEILLV